MRAFDRFGSEILRVLIYHRVANGVQSYGGHPDLISAFPDDFFEQMKYLAQHYRPINCDQLFQTVRGAADLPPRAVLVTFDDGYRDFTTYAWPILRACGVPAVLFVPTAFPDSDRHFWWDVVYNAIARTNADKLVLRGIGTFALRTRRQRRFAVEHLVRVLTWLRQDEIKEIISDLQTQLAVPIGGSPPVMSWEELRGLVREGLTVASHTRTHAALPTLTLQELSDEIEGAQADLERELGAAPPVFSYPFGHSDQRAVSILKARGIVAAFTAFTSKPIANVLRRSDPLLLRREAVNGSGSFIEFRLNLTPLYLGIQSAMHVGALRRLLRPWVKPAL